MVTEAREEEAKLVTMMVGLAVCWSRGRAMGFFAQGRRMRDEGGTEWCPLL